MRAMGYFAFRMAIAISSPSSSVPFVAKCTLIIGGMPEEIRATRAP